ncbi:hypothetical protein [Pasteuria penetrans]|uniref:hypothetical protein n=1 Tax=Pasteuria penetrans TaxID=86005 RepID=UPI000FBD3EEF|nr:hypothetical protein [Pasteuria penetrans]
MNWMMMHRRCIEKLSLGQDQKGMAIDSKSILGLRGTDSLFWQRATYSRIGSTQAFL